MARRFALYGVASTVFAFGVVSTALRTRANFYAAAVSIGKSSGSMMILGNFILFNAILLGIGVKKLFFGQLRTIEYEVSAGWFCARASRTPSQCLGLTGYYSIYGRNCGCS